MLLEVVAQRVFNQLYIYLDICFLIAFCTLLIIKKKYLTLCFSLFGGILYFVVDYGIFHLLTHSRSIEGGDMFLVLLWMSLSYGITNFAWIWLSFSKDKNLFEWLLLIVIWWIACPMLANTFGGNFNTIKIERTTGSYHGYMALILLLGYGFAIIYNLFNKNKEKRFQLLWLLIVGISVQFAWEFCLLIGGIRSAEITDFATKISTLIINSLLETNLGSVPIFVIYIFISSKINEDFSKNHLSFLERMIEINNTNIRG